MKGLPLAYHSDMQEDKEALFDAADTLRGTLGVLAPFLRALRFRADRLRALAGESFSTATDVAGYLVQRGLPFRDAHEVVGRAVRLALERGVRLEALPLEDLHALSPLFGSISARRSPSGLARRAERVRRHRSWPWLAPSWRRATSGDPESAARRRAGRGEPPARTRLALLCPPLAACGKRSPPSHRAPAAGGGQDLRPPW
jgi:hypothetical protein